MLKTIATISLAIVPSILVSAQAQAIVALQGFTGGSTFPAFNGTNQTIGWSFTANDNLSVNSLGLWDQVPSNPLNQSHQVGLWNSAGTLLSSTTIQTNSLLTGNFRYEAITPIALTSGQTYFLGSQIYSPFLDVYTSSASSITIAPEITFNGTTRNGSSAGFSFPSITGGGNGRFGPNFQFDVIVQSVPEPTSIIGLGVVGLGLLASKGKKQA